jgi:hypothetical protein
LHRIASGIWIAEDRTRDAPERAEASSVDGFDLWERDGLTTGHCEDDASAHEFLYLTQGV